MTAWKPTVRGFVRAVRASRPTPRKLLQAAVYLLTYPLRRKASPTLYAQRQEACERCIVYHHQRQTCGSPEQNKGCHCYMPLKGRLKFVNCWAWVGGWPTHLNGDQQ